MPIEIGPDAIKAMGRAGASLAEAGASLSAASRIVGSERRIADDDLESALRALLDEWEMSAKDAEVRREFALSQVREFYRCPAAFGWSTGSPHEWIDKAAEAHARVHNIVTMSEQLRRIVEAHFQTGDRDV